MLRNDRLVQTLVFLGSNQRIRFNETHDNRGGHGVCTRQHRRIRTSRWQHGWWKLAIRRSRRQQDDDRRINGRANDRWSWHQYEKRPRQLASGYDRHGGRFERPIQRGQRGSGNEQQQRPTARRPVNDRKGWRPSCSAGRPFLVRQHWLRCVRARPAARKSPLGLADRFTPNRNQPAWVRLDARGKRRRPTFTARGSPTGAPGRATFLQERTTTFCSMIAVTATLRPHPRVRT